MIMVARSSDDLSVPAGTKETEFALIPEGTLWIRDDTRVFALDQRDVLHFEIGFLFEECEKFLVIFH
jgi:hypothetical protein